MRNPFKRVVKNQAQTLAADLQDEKLRSSVILNSIEDGVVLIEKNNTIKLFNPAASNLTGWPATETVGLDWHNVIKLVNDKGETYEDSANPFTTVMNSETPVRDNTATLVSRNNKQFPVSLSLTPLRGQNGEAYGAVAVFRDVTQERQEEKQRSDFISTASHEMRTPVAAIEGYLALAMNEKVSTIDSRARNYLEKAHLATKHLGQLFQDLLTSAKAEDGRLTSHPIVVEIGAFLEQLESDLQIVAANKGLGMEFIVGSSQIIDATSESHNNIRPLYYTRADPDRLREVITNIFDNAVKYTDKGKISLGLTGNQNVVQFYIRDTGPGIPAEDIPHLFQKFYRVDNSATRTIGGTGLGLYICRKIVELYQGRIWVESELGKGSTFYINLPRLSTDAAQKALAEQESPAGGKPLTITPNTVIQ
jgi:two-component system, OmpR family, sensor histidine kinase VicK